MILKVTFLQSNALRPISATTEENIASVGQIVEEDNRITYRIIRKSNLEKLFRLITIFFVSQRLLNSQRIDEKKVIIPYI